MRTELYIRACESGYVGPMFVWIVQGVDEMLDGGVSDSTQSGDVGGKGLVTKRVQAHTRHCCDKRG